MDLYVYRISLFLSLCLLRSCQAICYSNVNNKITAHMSVTSCNDTSLDLSYKQIVECHEDAFTGYRKLMKLTMAHNTINKLHKNCFRDLEQLEELDLTYNKLEYLKTLPATVFDPLRNLKLLKLSLDVCISPWNDKPFPGRLVYNLVKLQKLYVHGIRLQKLPPEFRRLKKLRELYWKIGCTTQKTLSASFFEHLNSGYFTTLSIVGTELADYHASASFDNVEGNLTHYLPHLTQLNFPCHYKLGLNKFLNWIKSWTHVHLTHLNLDFISEARNGVTYIDSDLFCILGEVKFLSLRGSYSLELQDEIVFKCISTVKYLSFAGISPVTKGFTPSYILRPFTRSLNFSIETGDLSNVGGLLKYKEVCDNYFDSFDDWYWKPPVLPAVTFVQSRGFHKKMHQVQDDQTAWVPPSLRNIDASHLVLYSRQQIFKSVRAHGSSRAHAVSEPNSVTFINVSSNKIVEFRYPLYGLHLLQILDASHTDLIYIKPGYFSDTGPNLRFLNLSYNNVDAFGTGLAGVFQGANHLMDLDISSNNLKFIDDVFLSDIKQSIVRLNLASNKLNPFNNDLSGLHHLRFLSLANNQLSLLEAGVRSSLDLIQSNINNFDIIDGYRRLLNYKEGVLELDIRDNSFSCNCHNKEFIDWIKTTKVFLTDRKSLTCKDENNIDQIILDINLANVCPFNPAILVSVLMILVTIIFVILVYRYRWFIKWHYYSVRLKGRCRPRPRHTFLFDAFIVYDHEEDYRWVKYDLLPRAETQWNIRLLIAQRNWLIGASRAETVVDSIQDSRKVIWVITRNFVNCEWCDFDLQMTLVNKNLDDIIVLVIEDVLDCSRLTNTLASILKQQTYIEWTDDEDGQNLFWADLRNRLT